MLLTQLISQAHMHAIFRLVSQDPRHRKYSQRLDVVDLKMAPAPGRKKYVLDICFHRTTLTCRYLCGGCQLSEDFFYDKTARVKLNTNMFEHKKPTIRNIAPVEMEPLETRAGNAAYDSTGISHSLANAHLVICAIQNAIGKRVDPPAAPDKVLKDPGKALKKGIKG